MAKAVDEKIAKGEGGPFVESGAIRYKGGSIPVNTHGGNLSEGATQGSGHVREAVHQLQGLATGRQVPDARRAVLTLGGFFYNSQGLTLRRDAVKLTLSEATVKTHVARILTKLQLRDRVQAVVLAYETGLVSPGAGVQEG